MDNNEKKRKHPEMSLKSYDKRIDEEVAYDIDYQLKTNPVTFIGDNWANATDGVRLQMIEYIEEHPFAGCDKYTQQWASYLEHHKGRVLSLW